ncbi:MAG: MFS transporter [Syntrophobacteraceae bacterium]
MSVDGENASRLKQPDPTSAVGKRPFYGYAIVIASFCIWMVHWGSLQSFGVFYKPLTDEFGWSRAEVALAFSMLSIVHATAAIFMGSLTDRLGPRLIVTLFGSFVGISYLLLSQMSSLGQFYFYYAVVGALGMSTGNVPIMATVARWFTRRRALMVAIVQAGIGIGGFVFAPFSAWMIVNYGWRMAYEALGVILLVVGVISGLMLKRDPQSVQQLPDGIVLTEKSQPLPKTGQGTPGLPLKEAARTRQFWIAVGIFSCFGFCRSAFLPHIANHVQDLGFSISDGANVVALLTVSSIVGRVWLGCVENRSAFATSFAVTTVSLIWALMARELWSLYIFAIVLRTWLGGSGCSPVYCSG